MSSEPKEAKPAVTHITASWDDGSEVVFYPGNLGEATALSPDPKTYLYHHLNEEGRNILIGYIIQQREEAATQALSSPTSSDRHEDTKPCSFHVIPDCYNCSPKESKDQGQSVNIDEILEQYGDSEHTKAKLAIEQLISQRVVEELEEITTFFARPFEADSHLEKLLVAIEQRIDELKGGKE